MMVDIGMERVAALLDSQLDGKQRIRWPHKKPRNVYPLPYLLSSNNYFYKLT